MSVLNCGHISDTHQENIADIIVTDLKTEDFGTLDLLFISGDLTYRGDIDKLKRCAEQCEDLVSHGFVKDIVVVPGNHDKTFQRPKIVGLDKRSNWETPERAHGLFQNRKGVHLVIHRAIELQGLKIFGSPWTPWFHDWAYNYHEDKAEALWSEIPEDTQILVTHGPPFGFLDEVIDYDKDRRVGCPVLLERIKAIPSIKYHLFGHIHEGYGKVVNDGVTYLNSAIMNRAYLPTNRPQYFQINKE